MLAKAIGAEDSSASCHQEATCLPQTAGKGTSEGLRYQGTPPHPYCQVLGSLQSKENNIFLLIESRAGRLSPPFLPHYDFILFISSTYSSTLGEHHVFDGTQSSADNERHKPSMGHDCSLLLLRYKEIIIQLPPLGALLEDRLPVAQDPMSIIQRYQASPGWLRNNKHSRFTSSPTLCGHILNLSTGTFPLESQ